MQPEPTSDLYSNIKQNYLDWKDPKETYLTDPTSTRRQQRIQEAHLENLTNREILKTTNFLSKYEDSRSTQQKIAKKIKGKLLQKTNRDA